MMKKINWKTLKTKSGYCADEVISALQKDIRRGNTERAAFWAFELCCSGKEFQKKFWERMLTISVEDIGLANSLACIVVHDLKEAFYSNYENDDDALIQAIFAAVYLSRSKKDRFIDEIKNYFKLFKPNYKIPDYALDKHTEKGKSMKRGDWHFWKVAAKINPELKNRNKQYLKKILKFFECYRHE